MEILQETKTTTLTVSLELITPEKAKNFLRYNNNNRKLNNSHVIFLVNQIKQDLFLENGEAIIFDKKGILKDGQHRLKAISLCNKSFFIPIVRGVESKVMATYDTGKGRSATDVLYLNGFKYASQLAALTQSIDRFKYKKSKSQNIHSGGGRREKLTNQQVLEYVKINYYWMLPIVNIVDGIYQKQTLKVISATQLSLIAYLIGGQEPVKSVYDFLRHLAGINKEAETATSYLFTKLYNAKINKEPLNNYWVLGMAIKAYNYYSDGNPSVRYFKFNVNDDLPKVNG